MTVTHPAKYLPLCPTIVYPRVKWVQFHGVLVRWLWARSQSSKNLSFSIKEKLGKCQWWTVTGSIRITCIQHLQLVGFTGRHHSYCCLTKLTREATNFQILLRSKPGISRVSLVVSQWLEEKDPPSPAQPASYCPKTQVQLRNTDRHFQVNR